MSEISLVNNPNVGIDKTATGGPYVNELTTLNLGPTHPATHGIFQNILTMDGETIVDAEQTVGYIHRAFEKNCRKKTFIPNYHLDRPNELLFGSHQQHGMAHDCGKIVRY